MNEDYRPPSINSIHDIQQLLSTLEPNKDLDVKQIDVSAKLVGTTEASKINQNFAVNAKVSNLSHRSILLEAFKNIREKKNLLEHKKDVELLTINGKPMSRTSPINLDALNNVDSFISRTLGGYRSDEYVCWDLDDGYTYRYDVFKHQLTRKPNDD